MRRDKRKTDVRLFARSIIIPFKRKTFQEAENGGEGWGA